mgnify:CR=1 FL=1
MEQLKNVRVPVTISATAAEKLKVIADMKGLSVSALIRQIAEASSEMIGANYYKVLSAISTVGQEERS